MRNCSDFTVVLWNRVENKIGWRKWKKPWRCIDMEGIDWDCEKKFNPCIRLDNVKDGLDWLQLRRVSSRDLSEHVSYGRCLITELKRKFEHLHWFKATLILGPLYAFYFTEANRHPMMFSDGIHSVEWYCTEIKKKMMRLYNSKLKGG